MTPVHRLPHFIVVIFFLVAIFALNACGRRGPDDPASNNSVVVHPERFNAGEVTKGQVIQATFTLSNRSDRDVRISKIEADCRCTAIGTVGEMLQSGQSSDVTISVETDYLEGAMTRTTDVTIDGTYSLPLTVDATVIPEFASSVAQVDLGDVPGDAQIEKRFRIRRHPASSATVVAATTAVVDATTSIEKIAGGDAEVEVVVLAKGRSEPGRSIFGNIQIHTTSPHTPRLVVPLRGKYVAAGDPQIESPRP